PDLQATLLRWKRDREAAARELQLVERGADADQVTSVDEQIAKAEAMLWGLRESLQTDDKARLGEVLRELVSKVVLFFDHKTSESGKRRHAKLAHGAVYVRVDDRLKEFIQAAYSCGPDHFVNSQPKTAV